MAMQFDNCIVYHQQLEYFNIFISLQCQFIIDPLSKHYWSTFQQILSKNYPNFKATYAQKIKFSHKHLLNKWDKISIELQICSHLLEKS